MPQSTIRLFWLWYLPLLFYALIILTAYLVVLFTLRIGPTSIKNSISYPLTLRILLIVYYTSLSAHLFLILVYSFTVSSIRILIFIMGVSLLAFTSGNHLISVVHQLWAITICSSLCGIQSTTSSLELSHWGAFQPRSLAFAACLLLTVFSTPSQAASPIFHRFRWDPQCTPSVFKDRLISSFGNYFLSE